MLNINNDQQVMALAHMTTGTYFMHGPIPTFSKARSRDWTI